MSIFELVLEGRERGLGEELAETWALWKMEAEHRPE